MNFIKYLLLLFILLHSVINALHLQINFFYLRILSLLIAICSMITKFILDWTSTQAILSNPSCVPSEGFELTPNSLGAHMKVTGSSPGMGHGELILRTFIQLTVYSQDEQTVNLV